MILDVGKLDNFRGKVGRSPQRAVTPSLNTRTISYIAAIPNRRVSSVQFSWRRRCLFSWHSRSLLRSWLKFISDNCSTLSLHFRAPRILNRWRRWYWFNLHKLSGASERRERERERTVRRTPRREMWSLSLPLSLARSEISLKARKHETSEGREEGRKEHIGQQQHPHPHFRRGGNWAEQTQSLTAPVRDSIPDSPVGRDQRGSPGHRMMNHTVR